MDVNRVPDVSARQLRAVLALAEYRSFIAAASFVGVSQPALTRTIKQVERALGVALFVRTTRHVEITPAGREFARLAERVLNDLDIGLGSLRSQAAAQSGQVIVASVLSLAGAVLPSLLASFGARYPGIQIHLREGIHRDVVEDVRSGVADFGIAYVEGLPKSMLVEPVRSERLHVMMPADHPLARRTRVHLASLEREALVSFARESRSRQVVDGAAAAAGYSLRYVMTANRLATLLQLVGNGVGLAMLPASECASNPNAQLTSRPLQGPRFASRLAIVRLRERKLTPAASTLLVVVRSWLRSAVQTRAHMA